MFIILLILFPSARWNFFVMLGLSVSFLFHKFQFLAYSGDDYLVRNDNRISARYIIPKNQKQGI